MRKLFFASLLALFFTGCVSSMSDFDGDYLGGLLKVRTESSNSNSNMSVVANQQGEADADDQVIDRSARVQAQGACWIGCTSIEPPMMESFEFSIEGVDIDTAYTRVKRNFGFLTRDEKFSDNPQAKAWIDRLKDYRYQAVPGASYVMRAYTEHVYADEESPNTIQVELYKDGPQTVLCKVSFYSGNTDDIEGYSKSLKERITRVATKR